MTQRTCANLIQWYPPLHCPRIYKGLSTISGHYTRSFEVSKARPIVRRGVPFDRPLLRLSQHIIGPPLANKTATSNNTGPCLLINFAESSPSLSESRQENIYGAPSWSLTRFFPRNDKSSKMLSFTFWINQPKKNRKKFFFFFVLPHIVLTPEQMILTSSSSSSVDGWMEVSIRFFVSAIFRATQNKIKVARREKTFPKKR